jgi:hypothetical protein
MEEGNKRLQETDFDHYREAGTTIACFGNAREEGILAQAKKSVGACWIPLFSLEEGGLPST